MKSVYISFAVACLLNQASALKATEVDQDILDTQRSLKWAEAMKNHKLKPPGAGHKTWNYDINGDYENRRSFEPAFRAQTDSQSFAEYPVPNFGVDSDIIDTQRSIKQAEVMRSHKLKAPAAGHKTWNYDINGDYENRRGFEPAFRAQTEYVVPNFGVDTDIVDTKQSIQWAENHRHHKLGPAHPYQKSWMYFPVDYYDNVRSYSVPIRARRGRFGLTQRQAPIIYDQDIIDSYKSMRWAEAQRGYKLPEPKKHNKSWYYYPLEKDESYPRYNPHKSSRVQMYAEYPVPNFGVDQDILDTQAHIKQSEARLKHKLAAPGAGGKTWNYDVNGDYENRRGFEPAFRAQMFAEYPVPNFGVDQDILDTQAHIKQSEARLKHKLAAPGAGGKTWNYDVNGDYENRRGFEPAFRAQMFAETEYPVPNFGVDSDILDTQRSIKSAEKIRSRKLKDPAAGGKTWNYDINGDYENRKGFEPAFRAQTDSQSFAQQESEREPLLSNIQHYSDAPSYPINYPVPNFGVDPDIVSTQAHIKNTEKKMGRKITAPPASGKGSWNYEIEQYDNIRSYVPNSMRAQLEPESLAQTEYPVPNFGVDPDIVATQAHIKQQEKRLKHKLGKPFKTRKTWKYPIDEHGWPFEEFRDNPGYPINYKVPNFGVDSDIAQTQKYTKEAETKLGKAWKPKKDAKGKWILPHEDVEFKL